VNIGKNRTTSNENASHDYKVLLDLFADVADVFVVNISSPNTKGLRELLEPTQLAEFLKPLIKAKKQPLLLKLSPDMDDALLKRTLDVSLGAGVDGWVLTNTTLAREPNSRFSTEGGVSGRPLAERSKEILKIAVDHLGARREDRLIISSGGVLTPEDVNERLRLGANLVQVYAALIFDGPLFFRKVGDYNA
jgi:dihydroorotate dehydrogenase